MASIKIKDFFNGRFFEIPKYQRGYAWEIHNIRELFDDIKESIESNSNHYIGTIVLSKSKDDDEQFFIVDGQQRTTTIALIMSSLIKNLNEKNASFYERFYIKEEDRYRIKPLNRDTDFFVNLLEGQINEPQNKSQRYLKDAIEEIDFKISYIEDKLQFLKSVEKLEIMEFVENSEGDAIRIFQTVNDRGKPLSNMEKAKSLLIYFSNRYLNKKLDDTINICFSDIFEIYDDIKHLGEELGISLIKSKDFNEDNLMRYHFVTYSEENYDPTANYVLQFLKNQLTKLRNEENQGNYSKIEDFINSYIESLKDFFDSCRSLIERARTESKYYKLFVILNLSATLYPLVIKLEKMKLLDKKLSDTNRQKYTFFDLIELIEVRVYKTRATDPRAEISRFTYNIENKTAESIENWLIWFNNRWMSKEEFQSRLSSRIYGNRALNHIFITYCEQIGKKEYDIDELIEIVNKIPTMEHILAQTPTFEPIALGFENKEDFIEFEHCLGNLTILEKSLNSSLQHKNTLDKIEGYNKSIFYTTRMLSSEIDTRKEFKKTDLQNRTVTLSKFCAKRWWSDKPTEVPNEEEINFDIDGSNYIT